MLHRLTLAVLSVLITIPAVAPIPVAASETWPSKPLRIIVMAPPGGFPDSVARLLGNHIADSIGESVLVENRPGAGGNIASAVVAKSPPDGHTLLISGINQVSNRTLLPEPGFDYVEDLTPVTTAACTAVLMITRPDFPANSLSEVVELAKTRDKPLSVAVTAIGTPAYLAGNMLGTVTDTDFLIVPYQGTAPSLIDVISGEVDFALPSATEVAGFVGSGKLKALAVTSSERFSLLPDVETIAEAGYPDMGLNSWVGFWTTGGTPPAVVERLSEEIAKALEHPDVIENMRGRVTEPCTMQPAEMQAFLDSEYERWTPILKELKGN